MQTFATPAPITAVLDIPAGRVRIIAADRADTMVEVGPENASKGRDVQAAEQCKVAYRDDDGNGVLRIEAPAAKGQYFGPSGSIEVTVRLPAGSRVEAKASCAEFRAVGRLGDITVDGANGSIEIDEAAGVRLAAHAGDVAVGRLHGPAQISIQKGDITITEAGPGTVVLRTRMGDVSVGAAPGVSASLNAGTGYGRIDNTLTNTDGGAAGLTVHATTDHGNISARSL
ncbi:DUF4097 family beta strand repeat-containing protein [Streptomyces sp. SID3343]|uniref:DUF4097 family beta strand repeat-containing protein n=1 Tax=Streptomyces sp. SID3343 TaxID=2690260 RepID=UPI00136A7DA9|nr:DUF4097 family beta strand repeat-containing protein [Streptomyces sp. SID3343]MYV98784.1 DUF4097 family beta strand repeat protein [Streptomyces sp. SID3343]